MTTKLLFEGRDWTFETLARIHDACEEIALGELGLEVYPCRIEVITPEQMLDAYAATGMPLLYRHWSFGKRFVQHETMYQRGFSALAYEIVINAAPCIAYVMEGNTATMQTIVIAHAAFGHNHFFKNNYLFKQWTDPEGIISYLEYAQRYVTECEERYGDDAVEATLDAAHALMPQGIFRSPPKRPLDLRAVEARAKARASIETANYNVLFARTVPGNGKKAPEAGEAEKQNELLGLPQENILFFLQKFAPRLRPWQRELLRIVRNVAQYFYPQRQTRVMNEECATYVHYRVMTRLHEKGLISDGNYFEFLMSHTNVTRQPAFDERDYDGINPYALGFAMMRDIERIVSEPTDEDREWFPDIAGAGDVMAVLRDVWANYRDESFIAQFLSPRLIREWHMFHLHDDPGQPTMVVSAIHDERGYRRIRRELALQYDVGATDPDIAITEADLAGDCKLILRHNVREGMFLQKKDAERVMRHLANLWGYPVLLEEHSGKVVREHAAQPAAEFLALCAA